MPLYSDSVNKMSFRVKVQALGRVTSVGIAIMYKTSNAKVDTVMGAEQSVTVNTSGWADATLENVTMAPTPSGSGAIGVRIRILGVSSGNTYDLNNGFICEQAMLNQGMLAAQFRRRHRSFAEEVAACQRYYEKSYELNTIPAAVTTVGCFGYRASGPSAYDHVAFLARKRTTPTIVLYNSNSGATGTFRDISGPADVAHTADGVGESGFNTSSSGTTDGRIHQGHWTADAEI
jgi:hypothetical protein